MSDYFTKRIAQLKKEAAFCEKHGHVIGKVNRVHGSNIQYDCAKCGHGIWYIQDEPPISMKPHTKRGVFITWLFNKLAGTDAKDS